MMFKILTEGCKPTRGTKHSACVDLYSSKNIVIGAGETKVIGLGVCLDLDNSNVYMTSQYRWAEKKTTDINLLDSIKKQEIEDFMNSHYLQVALRSSLGKAGLIMPNGVGIIDMDYRDEIKVIIHNPITHIFNIEKEDMSLFTYGHSNKKGCMSENIAIKKGQRIAQITLLEHKSEFFGIESDVVRNGGLGSTDTVS